MVCLDERGASDIFVIVFMFTLLIISAAFLIEYNSQGLDAAADRRLGIKTDYLHRSLEAIDIRPGVGALEEAASQLVFEKPRVEENYLRIWLENSIEFLRPLNRMVEVRLVRGSRTWSVTRPENIELGENILKESLVSFTTTNGNLISVGFEIRVFEPDSSL